MGVGFQGRMQKSEPKIDNEIALLSKRATQEKREGDISSAVQTLIKMLRLIPKAELSYSHSTFTKILPYIQFSGEYDDLEKFCFNFLLPLIKDHIRNSMHKGANLIFLDSVESLYSVHVYDKLRLCAERESRKEDARRFATISNHYGMRLDSINEQIQRIREKGGII